MSGDFDNYPVSPRATILLVGIPQYESMKAPVDPTEIIEVGYRFRKLISTYAPVQFDIAGGELNQEEVEALGLAKPEYSGSLSIVVSNQAGSGERQAIDLVHFTTAGEWTEKFTYYSDADGEVRRKDYRIGEDDQNDERCWEERESDASFGRTFGINDMHVGRQEMSALERIVSAGVKSVRNTRASR